MTRRHQAQAVLSRMLHACSFMLPACVRRCHICCTIWRRVSWDQVVLCMPDSDEAAQQQAAALGFYCRQAWDDTCTHLVVGQAQGLSPSAACACAAGKPIVDKQW